MIQYRYDAARQALPAQTSYFSLHAIPRRAGRQPGLKGGKGTGIHCPALLRQIERAIVSHGISATRFGKDATNDPTIVHRMRQSARISPPMRDRLLAFIASLDCGEA